LAARLHPDPLGELTHSPDHLAAMGPTYKGREGREGRREGTEGRGREFSPSQGE